MSSVAVEGTVRKFIDRINAHDSHAILALCAPNHVFIDSVGTRLSGHPQIEQGWNNYFALFPDYRIDVDTMISAGGAVLLCGWASATHQGSSISWRIPAAWRVAIVDERIAEWQVYADNKPVYEILSRDAVN